MSLLINKVGSVSFRANEKNISEKKVETISQDKGMSKENKILLGLAATATAVVGGILIKKKLDVKAAEELAKRASNALQKPETFSLDMVREIADEWKSAGKLCDGDEVIIMPKSLLDVLAKEKNSVKSGWSKFYNAMKMSDNGFGIILRKADKNIDTSTIKYFDPVNNVELKIVDSLKQDKIVIMPISE